MKHAIIIGAGLILFALFVRWGANLQKRRDALRELLPKIMEDDWMAGRSIVSRLRRDGFKISGPQFYCFMSDLQNEGFLEFEDRLKIIPASSMRDSVGLQGQKIVVANFRTAEVELKIRRFRLLKPRMENPAAES